MKLSERLKELRQQRKAKLRDIAESTELSISYLSDLERGIVNPSLDTLGKLAGFFHLSLVDLVLGVDGWGEASWEGLAPGLRALLEMKQISADVASDLNRISLLGLRPQTEDEWLSIYCLLRMIVERK